MRLQDVVVDFLARRLGVPLRAVRLFRTARAFSGLQRGNLPTELIPLNVTQLARGVLNFAVLQSLEEWVFPFWVNRQFDPEDSSFMPRSHTGILMNTTQRNWTAVGNPDVSVEPIVDPRGMVTPLHDGWSIDTWLAVDGAAFFPSQSEHFTQSLLDGLPVVRSAATFHDIEMQMTTWSEGPSLYHKLEIRNNGTTSVVCKPAFAIRPFNPEGVSPIHELSRSADTSEIVVEGHVGIRFSKRPAMVHCSNRELGDTAPQFARLEPVAGVDHVHCKHGLANAVAVFEIRLAGGQQWDVTLRCPLEQEADKKLISFPTHESIRKDWEALLARGTKICVPDTRVMEYLRSSLTTLLQLTDGETITPGPYTYHLFWFRDAAYMLAALSKFGYHDIVGKIIRSFEKYQEPSGYFRSQKGEWDSNGQALWIIGEHVMLSKDMPLAEALQSSARRAIEWITHTRTLAGDTATPNRVPGLLPPGLSAEHLGLTDLYFWDNFWGLAGLHAHARTSRLAGWKGEAEATEALASDYKQDILSAMEPALMKVGAIPAGPFRSWDHGAIGSCCAFYPLEIFGRSDPKVKSTLDALVRTFSHNGLFLQHFIHSGINPYLSLHIAQGYLYIGDRKEFLRIFHAVLKLGSPTRAFPEAIHPRTGGGSMGDGHHGWVAAEILTSSRNAFVFEVWGDAGGAHRLVLLGGVDPAWFDADTQFSIAGAPVPEGTLDLAVDPSRTAAIISLRLDIARDFSPGIWELRLPFACTSVEIDGKPAGVIVTPHEESVVEIQGKGGTSRIVAHRRDSVKNSL